MMCGFFLRLEERLAALHRVTNTEVIISILEMNDMNELLNIIMQFLSPDRLLYSPDPGLFLTLSALVKLSPEELACAFVT